MTNRCCWEQLWWWVCTSSSVSSIGRTETVCNISISEVKCFQSQRCYLVLPAWNSNLRFVSCILSVNTSSYGVSSQWNDMASGWNCFCYCCCCYCCCCCCCCRKVVFTVVIVDWNFGQLSCHSPKRFCLICSLSLLVQFEIFFKNLFWSILVNDEHL